MTEENKSTYIKCECGYLVFDGKILKARFIHFDKEQAVAHCRRCKREVVIPVIKKTA